MPEIRTAVLAVLEQVSVLIRSLDDQTFLDLAAGRIVLTVQRTAGQPIAGGVASVDRPNSLRAPEGAPQGNAGNTEDRSTVVAGQTDAAAVRRRLDEIRSREEARAFLAHIARNKNALQQLGRDLGVRVSLSSRRDDMIEKIVSSTVGVRLDQEGIRRRLTSL